MPAISLLRSKIPASHFGSGRESKPAIAIGDNGQIRFSTSLTKDVIGKCGFLNLTFDAETRRFGFQPVMAPPAGMTEEDLFPISRGKDGESKQAYFGASSLLSCEEAGIKYDYKASGTQIFEPELKVPKKGGATIMYITLPNSLPPRPKQVRAKKEVPAPAPAKTPAPAVDEDDID